MMGKFIPVVTTKYSTSMPKQELMTNGFKSSYTLKFRKTETNCGSRPAGKRFMSRLVAK